MTIDSGTGWLRNSCRVIIQLIISDEWAILYVKKRPSGHTKGEREIERFQARSWLQVHVPLLWAAHLPGKTCILYRSLSFSVRSPWHAAPRSHRSTNVKCIVCARNPSRLSIPLRSLLFTNWNQDTRWQKVWPGHMWVKSAGFLDSWFQILRT